MTGHKDKVVYSKHEAATGTFKAYVTGFIVSVLLTLVAFAVVNNHIHAKDPAFSNVAIVAFVICLAIVQLFVQLVCFLHVGRESKPRWNLMALVFALIVVLIIVGGSLWIMSSLDYRMMRAPDEVNRYLKEQDRL